MSFINDTSSAADHHLPSSSSSSACLPAVPVGTTTTGTTSISGQQQRPAVPAASSSCFSSLHSLLLSSNPCAIGVFVVALVGLVVLVSALSPTAAIGIGPAQQSTDPSAAVAAAQYAAGVSAATRQSSQFAPLGPRMGSSDQQQIDALRARLDQLQYELGQIQLLPYTTASSSSWQEPAWPPSFITTMDYYNQHPKALLTRRHMAWQSMRRGTDNDEHSSSVVPRHVSWQPMKRQQTDYGSGGQPQYGMGGAAEDGAVHVDDDERKEHVVRTVEQQLIEVLKAGDRLGVSADQILAHLRARGQYAGSGLV